MSQPIQTINIVAPGFMGLNTEESPLTLEPSFATVADNCVIDQYGRLSARQGVTLMTSDATELGSSYIQRVKEFRDSSGNSVVFSCGNNKILSGTTTLVDETPAAYSITSDNWKMVNFNEHIYFFQKGYEPLVYSDTIGAVIKLSTHASYSGSAPQGGEVLASFGRLWVADGVNDPSRVYWSDLLNGAGWSGGTSGSIDLSKVWPTGEDRVVALAAHNNTLIIFGEHSILAYGGAESPANMALVDTVVGVGCMSRDSVQYTGTDVLFMSYSGLKSFGRTIQEKSMPLNTLSGTIKKDLIRTVSIETGAVSSVYSPEQEFYLIYFPTSKVVYCFNIAGTLENGSFRVTRWPTEDFKCFDCVTINNYCHLHIGTSSGIGMYGGYTDLGNNYVLRYYSPHLTFGDPSKLKLLKKIKPTIIGGSGSEITFKWGFGFSGSFKSQVLSLANLSDASYFGVSEYNVAEYAGGASYYTPNINTTGEGTNVIVGFEADIGATLSLQEFNVYTLVGKIV